MNDATVLETIAHPSEVGCMLAVFGADRLRRLFALAGIWALLNGITDIVRAFRLRGGTS